MKLMLEFNKTVISISKKQVEILEFLMLGYQHKKIAKYMNISYRTVDSHILNLTSKFHMPILELLSLYRCSQCKLFKTYACEESKSEVELLPALNQFHYY